MYSSSVISNKIVCATSAADTGARQDLVYKDCRRGRGGAGWGWGLSIAKQLP